MAIRLTRANAVFLHVPKTGGHWIEAALARLNIDFVRAPHVGGVTNRHALLRHLTRKGAFCFTFVRNPLEWYESWWKFQAGRWEVFEPGVWHPQRVLESCADDDFGRFVQNCLRREPGYVTRLYEWYAGPPGDTCVDFVGRHERLAPDLAHVLTRLGYDVSVAQLREIPPQNVSPGRCGRPQWDTALRKSIENAERSAIRRFYGAGEE